MSLLDRFSIDCEFILIPLFSFGIPGRINLSMPNLSMRTDDDNDGLAAVTVSILVAGVSAKGLIPRTMITGEERFDVTNTSASTIVRLPHFALTIIIVSLAIRYIISSDIILVLMEMI
jgi:hypothetical protein